MELKEIIDELQNYLIEIVGTVLFLFGAGLLLGLNILGLSLGDVMVSLGGTIVAVAIMAFGLLLMGYKPIYHAALKLIEILKK